MERILAPLIIGSNIDDIHQFHKVQRGIIMIWFLAILFWFIFSLVQLCTNSYSKFLNNQEIYNSGQLHEPQRAMQSAENMAGKGSQLKVVTSKIGITSVVKQSNQSTAKPSHSQEVYHQQDSCCDKFSKVVNHFFRHFAVLILVLLCFVTGTSFAFSLSWFLIVLVPMLLLNSLQLHKLLTKNLIVDALATSIFWFMCFFFILNIWVTKRFTYPYGMLENL